MRRKLVTAVIALTVAVSGAAEVCAVTGADAASTPVAGILGHGGCC